VCEYVYTCVCVCERVCVCVCMCVCVCVCVCVCSGIFESRTHYGQSSIPLMQSDSMIYTYICIYMSVCIYVHRRVCM